MQLHHHRLLDRAVGGGASRLASRRCPRSVLVRSGVNEDVLAKLRAAEEEAARLRAQLAIAQEAKVRKRAPDRARLTSHHHTRPPS